MSDGKDARKIYRPDMASKKERDAVLENGSRNIIDLLAGTWTSVAQGWNLIALPSGPRDQFRLLMNQYGETLNFNRFADLNVPNRGVGGVDKEDKDQKINAIAYEQIVHQKAADDCPGSNLKAADGEGIHHEPGFFLQLLNHRSTGHTEEDGKANGLDERLEIARQASIPHGNSVLAMGTIETFDGPPKIQPENARPERIGGDPKDEDFANIGYLAPYLHFQQSPFFGNVPKTATNERGESFPGFFPKDANAILKFANPGDRVANTTLLHFDTKYRNKELQAIPISNIPFVVREANVTEMHADFWIMELKNTNKAADPEFVMQYSQTVYLEFFNALDGSAKKIRWPHISINTLRRS